MLVLTTSLSQADLLSADQDTVFDSGPRKVTLVELYTSEGCSSCPVADAWISKFRDDKRLRREIVPLAFHVGYWDDLGSKDNFGRAEFSLHQRRHHESNVRSVYTPEFVINAMEWRGFFRSHALPAWSRQNPGNLRLTISSDGVTLFNQCESQSPLIANLVLLGSEIESKIHVGENAGQTLTHNFCRAGSPEPEATG